MGRASPSITLSGGPIHRGAADPRFVFVTWNGGGNLTPPLGIARALTERGHRVRFLGEESQRPRVESPSQGFAAYAPQAEWVARCRRIRWSGRHGCSGTCG
jgi:hypothetical protein